MQRITWETIDENLFNEAGEKIVSVSNKKEYVEDMRVQNVRVLDFLENKYPDRTFRLSKWHNHDFGIYQEIEERTVEEVDICPDCGGESDVYGCIC